MDFQPFVILLLLIKGRNLRPAQCGVYKHCFFMKNFSLTEVATDFQDSRPASWRPVMLIQKASNYLFIRYGMDEMPVYLTGHPVTPFMM
jgi:hypothetical protein